MANFFTKEVSQSYDERNSKLTPISGNMHFLIRLVLKELPARARVLCVGVGTGAEILSLASANPEWTFVGVDPSDSMLEVCRERLKEAGFLSRCELIHGFVQDLPGGEQYDAAVSVLVSHFVKREERQEFFRQIVSRVLKGGYFVNTEISVDLDAAEFPSLLKNWEQVQTLMGATPESLAALPKQMREALTVLPPSEVERVMRQSGVAMPIRFYQAFLISGWYGKKA